MRPTSWLPTTYKELQEAFEAWSGASSTRERLILEGCGKHPRFDQSRTHQVTEVLAGGSSCPCSNSGSGERGRRTTSTAFILAARTAEQHNLAIGALVVHSSAGQQEESWRSFPGHTAVSG
ncbi:hypothetical protein ACLKA7_007880 [Drosophila subpalustris]